MATWNFSFIACEIQTHLQHLLNLKLFSDVGNYEAIAEVNAIVITEEKCFLVGMQEINDLR